MIKAEHVNYIYQPGMPFESQALFDINLEVPDGSFAAIIGHTGSGKSTLIQHFNALIRPTSGRIIIDGLDVADPKTDLREIRKNVGLVFQYPEYQLFEETVAKDIAFGPRNMGLEESEISRRVRASAELVGLSEKYLGKSPFELSGGQKRRAAIAGVLAMEPRVLILDEPTAGLDPRGRDDILDMLKALHRERREMTILFVSHSMEDVARVADYVYVMNSGRLAMEGTVAEVFTRGKELRQMGLETPQITRLCDILREAGVAVDDEVYTVGYARDMLLKLLKGGDGCVS